MKLRAVILGAVLLGSPVVAVADQLDDDYQAIQQAVAKKDPAQVKKLAVEMAPLLTQALAVPAPASAEEKATWTTHNEYLKSVREYVDYALFATAVVSPAAAMVDLISTLEQQNPKSKYLDGAYGAYLSALHQTGGQAKIPAVADKALENFPENADLLAVVMESAWGKGAKDRAMMCANRLTAVFGRPKPAGVSDAEWARKRSVSLGRAYWIAGIVTAERNDYEVANTNLRAALPLIQGNNAMLGPALFYLGLANYQRGKLLLNKARVLEAAKFSEQCAAIPGQYADQARHNAIVMKSDADKMR